VCVLLYEDVNGNGLRDATEGSLAGGILSVVDMQSGKTVDSYATKAGETDPHCFDNLLAGVYAISAAPPTGYNPTTANSTQLQVAAGMYSSIEFGAQPGAGKGGGVAQPSGTDTRLRTALVGAAGVVFLLLAAGVAGFLVLRRPQ
jgi:hypothetical protein